MISKSLETNTSHIKADALQRYADFLFADFTKKNQVAACGVNILVFAEELFATLRCTARTMYQPFHTKFNFTPQIYWFIFNCAIKYKVMLEFLLSLR